MNTPARSTPGRPATGAYVISAQEISPGWVLLYAGTFALQAVCAAIRGLGAAVCSGPGAAA
jgi:hypothetical protein